MAKIDLDQVRRDVNWAPGKWVREGDILVAYGTGSPSKRKPVTRIGVTYQSGDVEKSEPVLVVEGSQSGQIRDKLKTQGYRAIAGTVES